jgi:hypothetical protein
VGMLRFAATWKASITEEINDEGFEFGGLGDGLEGLVEI